jgi:DNA mismatch repair protein MutL
VLEERTATTAGDYGIRGVGAPVTAIIRRLPEDLANKIAAGEVVERPASVVKELAENALDAGARTVHVDIERGGKSLVRVRDDGSGMPRADAALAVERHATSKLADLAGLTRIATHGFRGEALPSVASVSELVLRTRAEGDAAGTEVAVRHGRLLHVRDVGHPRGTTVEVRDLFGSVPARQKFLRADATESSHVGEALTLLALARPDVGFFLGSGGRRTLEAPPVDSLAARVFQLFGRAALEELHPVEGVTGAVAVRGFASRPSAGAPGRPTLRLFVNGRSVRDRGVARAVAEAYRLAGAGERPYEALLMVEVPLEAVDVNVHPAKAEVRFAEPRAVWAAVQQAVLAAVSEGARERGAVVDLMPARRAWAGALPPDTVNESPWVPWQPQDGSSAAGPSLATPVPQIGLEGVPPVLMALGQHRATYVVATDGQELVLVDQHTAHERVRYERLLDQLEQGSPASQMLLVPIVSEVPPRLRPLLDAQAPLLRRVGYDVEEFGGGSIRITAVPALLPADDHGRTLLAMLADLADRDDGDWAVSQAVEKLAATVACHSAVRAGQPLAREAMTQLLHDVLRARHPGLCPHGRPTMVRIPQSEVARWFGRTGWRRQ